MSEAQHDARSAAVRIAAALAAALAFCLGVYALISVAGPAAGLVGFTFLLVLPAAVSAFVTYVADPWKTRSHAFYLWTPVWILGAVIIAGGLLLGEGAICILLLSPLWLISGMIGAEITYNLRRRTKDGRVYCSAAILLPLISMQIEPYVPIPASMTTVSREIVINAPASKIWPLLRGIPDIQPGEGRWNISQDLIGLPRPIGAHLDRDGIGADRHALWEHHIRFREKITDWQMGRRIGWVFLFDDIAGWGYTDQHVMPNSPYFTVKTGGYQLDPLPGGKSRVTLHTEYRIQTPVNAYSKLWGQLLLGDVQNNILAIIKQRAERPSPPTA